MTNVLRAPLRLLFSGEAPAGLRDSPGVLTGTDWWSIPGPRQSLADSLGGEAGRSSLSLSLRSAPPRVVVTDADSTLFEEEVIDLLADAAGVGAKVAAITESAMAGDMDFTQSLKQRVALLHGLPKSELAKVRAQLTLTRGTRELIKWTHDQGAQFGVVSGGFSQVLRPLLDELGVDRMRANDLEVVDGKLTGKVSGPIIDESAKREALVQWSGGLPASAIAIGDGANDIQMLREAGVGIAFCAKPLVRAKADSFLDLPRLDVVPGLIGFSS